MRQWGVFTALVGVALAAWPVTGQTVADRLIVPGERVAAVALGMPLNQGIAAAIATFGGSLIDASGGSVPSLFLGCQPERAGEVCIMRAWRTANGGTVILTFLGSSQDSAHLAMILLLNMPEYRTAEGIATRVLAADVARAYGPPAYIGPRLPYAPGRAVDQSGSRFVWHWWANRGLAVAVGSGPVLAIAVLRAQ